MDGLFAWEKAVLSLKLLTRHESKSTKRAPPHSWGHERSCEAEHALENSNYRILPCKQNEAPGWVPRPKLQRRSLPTPAAPWAEWRGGGGGTGRGAAGVVLLGRPTRGSQE